jgi:hypothetical protein
VLISSSGSWSGPAARRARAAIFCPVLVETADRVRATLTGDLPPSGGRGRKEPSRPTRSTYP